MVSDFASQLADVQHSLGQVLSKKNVIRILDSLTDETRIIFQAVIRILGHRYMYDTTFYVVFNKKTTLQRIQNMTHCQADKVEIKKIRKWINDRKRIFAGDFKKQQLLSALIRWCKLMVNKRNPMIKKVFADSSIPQKNKVKSTPIVDRNDQSKVSKVESSRKYQQNPNASRQSVTRSISERISRSDSADKRQNEHIVDLQVDHKENQNGPKSVNREIKKELLERLDMMMHEPQLPRTQKTVKLEVNRDNQTVEDQNTEIMVTHPLTRPLVSSSNWMNSQHDFERDVFRSKPQQVTSSSSKWKNKKMKKMKIKKSKDMKTKTSLKSKDKKLKKATKSRKKKRIKNQQKKSKNVPDVSTGVKKPVGKKVKKVRPVTVCARGYYLENRADFKFRESAVSDGLSIRFSEMTEIDHFGNNGVPDIGVPDSGESGLPPFREYSELSDHEYSASKCNEFVMAGNAETEEMKDVIVFARNEIVRLENEKKTTDDKYATQNAEIERLKRELTKLKAQSLRHRNVEDEKDKGCKCVVM